MQNQEYQFNPGQAYPSGAKQQKDGVNFSIFSRHATHVELLLFTTSQSIKPFQVINLDKNKHKTFFFMACLCAGFTRRHLVYLAYRWSQ